MVRAALVLTCLFVGACIPPEEEAASPAQQAAVAPAPVAQPNPGQWAQQPAPTPPPPQAQPGAPVPVGQPQGASWPFLVPTAWPTEWPAIPGFPQPQPAPPPQQPQQRPTPPSAPPAFPWAIPSLPAGPVPTPWVAPGAPSNDAAQHCVDEINRYRATKALPALARWTDGEPCAVTEARDDSQSGKAHGTFGRCQERSQNACPGWPGKPGEVLDGCLRMMWNEGPGGGHYENMIDTKVTRVACGTYAMPGGKIWSVQDFR